MKKRNKKKTGLVAILLILVLLISVGYATISTNLNIGGNATITAQNWLVYFTNIETTAGSVTPTTAPTTSGTSTTTLTWAVSLDTPGQFYEYTVDVKNDGSINAMIGTLSNSTLTTAQAKYLDYTVTYSDGATIEQYDKLDAGATETLRVRVEFKSDPEELPATASAITLNYASNYVQADTTYAKERNTIAAGGNTIESKLSEITLGDYVDIGTSILPANTTIGNNEVVKEDWRVLAKDENGMTIILSKFLPNSEGTASSLGMATNDEYLVDVDWSDDCLDQLYNKLNADWSRVITGSDVIGQQGVTVKGAPSIEDWTNSWNKKGYTHIYTRAAAHGYPDITDLDSYYVGTDGQNTTRTGTYFEGNYIGLNDSLYFPKFPEEEYDYFYYWIANPSQNGEYAFNAADNIEGITPLIVCGGGAATRPIVYLPSNLTITQTENGWKVE